MTVAQRVCKDCGEQFKQQKRNFSVPWLRCRYCSNKYVLSKAKFRRTKVQKIEQKLRFSGNVGRAKSLKCSSCGEGPIQHKDRIDCENDKGKLTTYHRECWLRL